MWWNARGFDRTTSVCREMRMRHVIAGVLALWLAGFAGPADATVPSAVARLPCADHRELRSLLGERFGEEPTSFGLASDGNLLELYVSARGDSWSLVSVGPGGMGCVVAVGRGWIDRGRPAPGSDGPEA